MTASPMLEAHFVVSRRSFDVAAELLLSAGESLSLFGPSGAGKTTCLEAIAGLAPLAQGTIRLDGRLVNSAAGERRWRRLPERPVEPRDRGVSLVRQPTTLFAHLSVRGNVTYGVRSPVLFGGRSVEQTLELVGLGGLGDVMPDRLSGGQRQRACLARALARPFRALLLDEPFSAVDASSRTLLRSIAADAALVAGAVAVLVTHDLAEAQAFGHRLGIMDEGCLLQLGKPDEVVRQPATARVAELCGYRSFVPHAPGKLWALHPDRFVEGAWPDRGIVITGTVRSVEPFGPRFACEMVPAVIGPVRGGDLPVSDEDRNGAGAVATEGAGARGSERVVRVHADMPPRVGDRWDVTALGPPLVSTS